MRPEAFALPPGPLAVIRMVSAVITAIEERALAPGDLHVALLDRRGACITTGAVVGLAADLDGLATTLSTDYEILAVGRSRAALARAVNRLLELRGGVVLVDDDRVIFELALPVGGFMAARPLGELAAAERQLKALLQARGYTFHDPLFTLYVLTADFLPRVRLSARGIWDVRRQRVLRPEWGAQTWPPPPPNARTAAAEPWQSSIPRFVHGL